MEICGWLGVFGSMDDSSDWERRDQCVGDDSKGY